MGQAYLDSRGPDHRIAFLVDEVGQFIGQDTHLMLSLQTIVENLGTACGGRAWVVVTSQEDIDAIIGEVRASKANDFSKIQGRFKTRLSLSSGNVDEVIQKRLLAKTEEAARTELTDLYGGKRGHPQEPAQLQQRRHDLQALCRRPRTSPTSTPLRPTSSNWCRRSSRPSAATASPACTWPAASAPCWTPSSPPPCSSPKAETGVLVPLYRFYPAIESFLEGIVKSTIDNAEGNDKLDSLRRAGAPDPVPDPLRR
jgi:hypothetical protein